MKTKKIISAVSLISLFAFVNLAGADWQAGISAVSGYNLPDSSVSNIIATFLMWLLAIFTFLCVIAFVIAGVMFLMAGSNKNMLETAKNAVTYSIIGIAIGLIGYIVVRFVNELLRGTFS